MINKTHYDYTICGGGPTAMLLAYLLSSKYKVALLESDSQLGGCWKVECPQFVTGKHITKLLKSLHLPPQDDIVFTYKNAFFWAGFHNSNLSDKIKFTVSIFKYLSGLLPNTSVCHWLQDNNFSTLFQNYITQFCILLTDLPSELRIYHLMKNISLHPVYQFKQTEKWLYKLQQLLDNNHVDIFLNTQITKFYTPHSIRIHLFIPDTHPVSTFRELTSRNFILASPLKYNQEVDDKGNLFLTQEQI